MATKLIEAYENNDDQGFQDFLDQQQDVEGFLEWVSYLDKNKPRDDNWLRLIVSVLLDDCRESIPEQLKQRAINKFDIDFNTDSAQDIKEKVFAYEG